MPQRLSKRQQLWLQQLLEQQSQQLFSQPHDCSQQQLCSQQHDFSQQPQLGSQQQPQPLPSILSNKQKPKLGLARQMLTMRAPKKFFIAHRLLYVGTIRAEDNQLPATRDAAPRRVSVVNDGRIATPSR
jgi:hypothetical protein